MVTKSNQNNNETELGLLPKEWDVRTLDNVCQILDSKRVPLNKEQRDSMKGNIPYYGANGVVDYIDDYLFDEPLILMAEDGGYFNEYQSRPIAYKVEGKCWVNNHAHILRPMKIQSLNWIYYILVHKNVLNFISGGTRAKLNQSQLKKIPIAYPSITEQIKISDILITVDNTISQTEAIIEQTEKVKKGLMQQLLTKGIGHAKFKQAEIGEIPEEWEVKSLAEVTNFIDYRGKTPKKVDRGIKLITAKNVRNGYIDSYPEEFIKEEDYELWMTRGIPNYGDVLITTEAPLGNVAQLDIQGKVAFAQRVIIIQPKVMLDSSYLKYILISDQVQVVLDLYSTGSTVKGIKSSNLKKVQIPIPNLKEQQKISTILSNFDMKKHIEEKKLHQLQVLKKGLMQVLLTGKVRVKVNEQEVITQ